MGTTLTGLTPATTYDALIKVTDNGPLGGSLKTLTDGLGNDSALALSTGAASVTGTLSVSSNLTLSGYGSGTKTGTAAYNLAVDSSGNVIETAGGVVDGSGTANYVSKWSDPNTLTDSLIYDNGTNVGIGTSSPSRPLTVVSTQWDNSTGAGAIFSNSNSIGAGITLQPSASVVANGPNGWALYAGGPSAAIGDGNLGFWAHGTNDARMVIQRGGNVGIGTTTSTYDSGKIGSTHRFLNVQAGSGSYAVGTLAGNQSGNGDRIGYLTFVNANNSASYKYSAWIGSEVEGTTANQQGGRLIFSTTADASAAGPIERLRITSAGNVGIGTSSPIAGEGTPLTLQSSTGYVGISLSGTGSYANVWQLYASGDGASNKFFGIYDRNNGAYRLVTTSAGNVGIGTSSPTQRLDVSTSSGEAYIRVNSAANQDSGYRIAEGGTNKWLLYNISSLDSLAIYDNTANAERMRIASNGNLTIKGPTASNGGVLNLENTTTAVNGSDWGSINFISNDSSTSASGIRASIVGTATSFNGDGNIVFSTAPSNGVNTERMRVLATGNVGIGTTNPAKILTVSAPSGDTLLRTNAVTGSYAGLELTENNSTTSGQYWQINKVPTSHRLQFWNGSERLTILSNGNVGIGTASPATTLDVDGITTSDSFIVDGGAIFVGGSIGSANGLDDYEEGSWTPDFRGSAGTPTGFVANYIGGSYTKIGRMVVARMGVNIANVGTGGLGTLRVFGLPFTSANVGAYQEPTAPANGGRWVTALNAGNVYAFVGNANTYLEFRTMAANADTALQYSELQGGSASVGTWFTLVVTYFVS